MFASRARESKLAAMQPADVEAGCVRDRHHGHDAGLNGIGDNQIGGIGHAPSHIQADDEQPLRADLANRRFDVSAHQSPRHNARPGSR